MPKFRKKPVVIEARQLAPENAEELADWAGAKVFDDTDGHFVCLIIPTLEGKHRADIGDWIIKGVAGEFYPCKPDIFDATYEPVDG